MNKLVKELKENNQDKEFYPTTDEIIEVLKSNISSWDRYSDKSILDIGAGNGKVLNALECGKKYAIEQSEILINNMPKNIHTIGRDFHKNSIMDKKVDIIFCNPPYTEYDEWSARIIREGNARFIYLVIPTRYKDSKIIKEALVYRGIEDNRYSKAVDILGEFSFEDSEDRKARATVNLIRVNLGSSESPFKRAMKDTFKEEIERREESSNEDLTDIKDKFELVVGENLINRLLSLYMEENTKIFNSYKSIISIDKNLMEEIGVDLDKIEGSLEFKIANLKSIYWNILFDNFTKITERLTFMSRKDILNHLADGVGIDFTYENIHMVIMWVLKYSNEYYNSQLIEVYKRISNPDSIVNYKSNLKFVDDTWRYNSTKESASHYMLDKRIVIGSGYIEKDINVNSYCNDRNNNASTLTDLITITRNLGFECRTKFSDIEKYEYGKKYSFYMTNGEILFDFRMYKKGTVHIFINQNVLRAINIEVSRLLGWITSPSKMSEEMNIPIDEVNRYFDTNINLLNSDIKLLGV